MITAHAPEASGIDPKHFGLCIGCRGTKGAPLAAVVAIVDQDHLGVSFAICEECGRDTANAIGFMCIRDGGWSKLESRKRRIAL